MGYERTRNFIGLFVGFVVFSFLTIAGVRADDSARAAKTPAPDFTLPALNRDRPITLSDYRGTTILLDFWSAWCKPCRDAMPLQARLRDQFAAGGFEIIAVNLDANPADGRRVLDDHGVTHPVAIDLTGAAADLYGVTTLPAAFLIDGNGVLRAALPRLEATTFRDIQSTIRAALPQRAEQES